MNRSSSSRLLQVSSASRIQNSHEMHETPARGSSAAWSVCMCSQRPSAFMPVSASMSPIRPMATQGMRCGTAWNTAAVPRCSVAWYQSQFRATHGSGSCTTTPEHIGPSAETRDRSPANGVSAATAMSA